MPEVIRVNGRRVLVYRGLPSSPLVIGLHARGSDPYELARYLPFHTLPEKPTYALPWGSPDWDDLPWWDPRSWIPEFFRPELSWNAWNGVAGWAGANGANDAPFVAQIAMDLGARDLLLAGHSNGAHLAQLFARMTGDACATVAGTLSQALSGDPAARCLDIHGLKDFLVPLEGEIRIGDSALPSYSEARSLWGGRHALVTHLGGHEIPARIGDKRPVDIMWEWFRGHE